MDERSPWRGTWRANSRPVIRQCPDAVVYISGATDITGCPVCHRRIDLNRFITSVSTSLSVDSVPGTATIEMVIPRHDVPSFFRGGKFIVVPMMEVEIFIKGAFLVNGTPRYYPAFWGVTTSVATGYSSGETTVSVSCADILKLWEITKQNKVLGVGVSSHGGHTGGSTTMGNRYTGKDVFSVFYLTASDVFGQNIMVSGSMNTYFQGTNAKATELMTAMESYWKERWKRAAVNIRVWGLDGTFLPGIEARATDSAALAQAKRAIQDYVQRFDVRERRQMGQPSRPLEGTTVDYTKVTASKLFSSQIAPVFEIEAMSRLEVGTWLKDLIGYELFMDSDGAITFKPPWYNLDVATAHPIQTVRGIDLISLSQTEDESRVYTLAVAKGTFSRSMEMSLGEILQPMAFAFDPHLAMTYGWKTLDLSSEYFTSSRDLWFYAVDQLDRMNANRVEGSCEIPCRPEIRLGLPVYVEPYDCYYYVKSVEHTVAFGSRATTSLTLSSRRGRFTAESVPAASMTEPLRCVISENTTTGAPVPNVVMIPLTIDSKTVTRRDLAERVGDTAPVRAADASSLLERDRWMLEDAYARAGTLAAAPYGKWIYGTVNEAGVLFEALMPVQDKTVPPTGKTGRAPSRGMRTEAVAITEVPMALLVREKGKKAGKKGEGIYQLLPVSDERGYELTGHWPYGRGLALTPRGEIVSQDLATARELATLSVDESDGIESVDVPAITTTLGSGARSVDRVAEESSAKALAELSVLSGEACTCLVPEDDPVLRAILANAPQSTVTSQSGALRLEDVVAYLKETADRVAVDHAQRERELTEPSAGQLTFTPGTPQASWFNPDLVTSRTSAEDFLSIISGDASMQEALGVDPSDETAIRNAYERMAQRRTTR